MLDNATRFDFYSFLSVPTKTKHPMKKLNSLHSTKFSLSKRRLRTVAKGFTLVEILVTVALIALLTAIAVPAYSQYKTHGQNARKALIIDAVSAAKTAYLLNPSTTTAQQTAFATITDSARLALLEVTINNERVTSIDDLVEGTGETTMTIGDGETSPSIP